MKLKGKMVQLLSQTLLAQQTVTTLLVNINVSLVTPKAAAKLELLFNKPASSHLVGETSTPIYYHV